MDITAFAKLYKNAVPFCAEYDRKQLLLKVQLDYCKECPAHEKQIVMSWIKACSQWLEDNRAQYDKLKYLRAIPTKDINELFEVFKQ